jgi:hypothetical protein
MSIHPDPLQVLYLWALLARGGEGWKADLKPDLKGRYAPLRTAGLIEEEDRSHPDTGRRRKWVRLSEAGWAWAQAHLDAPVAPRSSASGPVLQALLARLKAYLAATGVPLAELVCPPGAGAAAGQAVAAPPVPPATLEARLRAAYLADSGGRWGVRVRLAALRQALRDIPRPILDATLLDLARAERLALYPLDDPLEVTAADREAALVRLGQPFHLVYMDPAA